MSFEGICYVYDISIIGGGNIPPSLGRPYIGAGAVRPTAPCFFNLRH